MAETVACSPHIDPSPRLRVPVSYPHQPIFSADPIYSYVPPAWWILIPVFNFQFGEELSPMAEIGIHDALTQILLLDKF
ncbi:MAG: hypothetical protein F6K35_02310 [Okeania sp. SIO2H7]|nr:hypothetical protein [Okeania sp. SIO2H7]